MSMFLEALQSYYAPVVALIVFCVILFKDKLFSKRIRNLFLTEMLVILLIIVATWADRCLSAMTMDGMAWQLRTVTTFLNFTLSPFSPAILVSIYRDIPIRRQKFFYIPLLLNTICCITSIFNGCIFEITSKNVYQRGLLFGLPFIVSFFYMVSLVIFSWRETKRNRKSETYILFTIMVCIGIASILEVTLVIRFMIWSTTFVCVLMYFLILCIQKIVYEPLTGVFSRVAYDWKMGRIQERRKCIYVMVDVNNLKDINDTEGHSQGDEAISKVARALDRGTNRNKNVYRIGGDEFVILATKESMSDVKKHVVKAQKWCDENTNARVSFAYGIAEYRPGMPMEEIIRKADEKMYECKEEMKRPK